MVEHCLDHEGHAARIQNLEDFRVEQKKTNTALYDRTNAIFTRLNVILGGIVVAIILLLVNVLFFHR